MKRWLLTIGIFLLLGAVVNVAVAWGTLWIAGDWSPVWGVTAPEHPRWRVFVGRGPGATVVRSSASRKPRPRGVLPPDATQEEIDAWLRGEAVRVPRDVVPVPYWSRGSRPPIKAEYETPSIWEEARGWPMRSLVTFHFDGGTSHSKLSWRLEVGRDGPLGLPRGLPLRPIPFGFAIDAALYAAILWLLICGPFTLRQLIRRWRGRCPECGYPMGESSVCSECGVELPFFGIA